MQMAFIIRANNKDYVVGDHAARRMRERFISEEMVIETLQRGDMTQQPHGVDLYEYTLFFEETQETVIIQVAVIEEKRFIKSVIDDTQTQDEG
jgi:Domain of unknown function (DUF4258)